MSERTLSDRIAKRPESDPRDPGVHPPIHGFHAHVYFRNPQERDFALALREDIARTHPEARLGRIHDRAIVVHTAPMYQVYFPPEAFGEIVPWLMLRRGKLSILVHALTGDVLAEHRDWPLWLGEPLPLLIDRLQPSAHRSPGAASREPVRERGPAIEESNMPSSQSPPQQESLHGDLRVRASADTKAMEWTSSPSGSVWRKRVHLVGPPESGQVTSIVRYEPDSTFPAHDHPEGEEILVLEGVFSDEHGDWPAGTYLLNPEGFRHAPFSRPGCVLLVKLRQYPGADRRHVVIDTRKGSWQPTGTPGIERQPLYEQAGYSDVSCLERWAPGTDPGEVVHPDGTEIFVLEGALVDETGQFEAGSWLRLPVGHAHRPRSEIGCTLYVKRGGLAYLRAAPRSEPSSR